MDPRTALVDTMHQFSMFMNRHWSSEMATASSVATMHVQLHQHFGSTSYGPCPDPRNEKEYENGFIVSHEFPDYRIVVAVAPTGHARVTGEVKAVHKISKDVHLEVPVYRQG